MGAGTAFCAATERTKHLAHKINSQFGWDPFGLVTSSVKIPPQNITVLISEMLQSVLRYL